MTARDLGPGEWAVLCLVCEGRTHGFAVARTLEPGRELGRIWSLRRPLVYRALHELEARGLVEPAGTEEGAGPARALVRPTRAGRAAVRSWLREPVAHVRDARSLLLLKLAFCERSGTDTRPLLEAQLSVLEPVQEAYAAAGDADEPVERLLARFRLEAAVAVRRFVAGELA